MDSFRYKKLYGGSGLFRLGLGIVFTISILISLTFLFFAQAAEINPSYQNEMMVLSHFNNDSFYGENSTLAYDFTGLGNNATCPPTDCPIYNSAGMIGGAYDYNGSASDDRYFTIKDVDGVDFDSSENFTIAAWVKANTIVSAHMTIVSKVGISVSASKRWAIKIANNGRFRCIFHNSTVNTNFDSGSNLDDGSWHHVACVLDRTAGYFYSYIDGVQINSSPSVNGEFNNTASVFIGKYDPSDAAAQQFFNGTIDELGIWNRSLSLDEIRQLYETGRGNLTNCTNITSPGNYLLGADIVSSSISYCINISSNNVTLDCQEYKIEGDATATYGIYVNSSQQVSNITIKNCILNNWATAAVYINKTANSSFFNLTIKNNTNTGLILENSYFTNLTNITITNTTTCLELDNAGESGPNLIYNNLFNCSTFISYAATNFSNSYNTTNQTSSRIYSNGTRIGGNYWTNSSGQGYSDTCTDADADGFCDSPLNLTNMVACSGASCSTNQTDYLPLSDEFTNAPDDPSVQINSTGGTNTTLEDLNCNATITDPDDGDLLNVTVQWYRNNTLNLTTYYNNSYPNATNFVATLTSSNTSSNNEWWNCSIRLHDGKKYSNWVNSSNLTISSGTTPSITIDSPINQTYSTGDIDYNITVSEVLYNATYSLNSSYNYSLTNDSSTHYYNLSANHPTLGDGAYNLSFFVNNSLGNSNTSIVYFTVDTTAPTTHQQ
jgi:hypothetical protein